MFPTFFQKFLTFSIVIILIFSGCSKREKKVKEEKKEELPVVKVEIVRPSSIEEIITSTGTIEPDTSVKISAKIGGKIESIYCKEGDYVEKNSILLKLETKELLAQKAQTEAMKKQALANLENIKKNYQRMKNLYSEGIVSQQNFEQIETSLEVIKSQLESAEASINLIDTQLENSVIKSPISGIIAKKMVEPGEVVGPGIPVFQIIDINNVKVKIGISEEKIKDLKIGEKVRIYPSAYPEQKFEGYISLISPSANPINKLFDVEVKIKNKDRLLKPGMFVNVEIVSKKIENAIVVPESAILEEEGKKFVFVYENGIVRKKFVETGIEEKGKIEIKSGLNIGEFIITEGNYELQDGIKVIKEE